MKSLKYILMFLVAAVTFTACQEEWAPGAPDSPTSVYFSADTRDVTISKEDKSVELTVYRATAGDALTVNLLAEATVDDTPVDLFTLPTSVSFAEGEIESKVTIGFDADQLEPTVPYVISLQVKGEEYQGNYGPSSVKFAVTLPEPWVSLGTGVYFDDFLNILEDGIPGGLGTYVEFEVHADNPKRIRVVNPFSMEVFANLWGGVPGYLEWNSEENHYLEFDITDPTNVLVEPFYELPFKINFSDAGLLQAYMLIDTYDDGSYVEPVVLEDGFIKFPKGHVAMVYPYNGKLGGWYANAEGLTQYVLPGVEITDYSIFAEYAGMIVSADNTTTTAIIEFTLGADVEEYKFVVVPGSVEDLDATVASIVDGTAEGLVEATVEQTQYQVELETGTYSIVAVAFAGGEAVGTPVNNFFYFPGASTGEKPEAKVQFLVNSLANIFADDADRAAQMEATYPAEYFIGIVLGIENPAEVTGLKLYYNNRSVVEGAIENGKFESYSDIVDQYGNDVYAWVEGINEGNIRILNLPAGSDNCYIFAVNTIYGTTQYYHYEYAMPEYSGDFVPSQYVLSEGENVAGVNFTPGTSAETIFVEFEFFPSFEFYATFDAEAQTLTLNGQAYGYEQYESLFGMGLPVGPSEAEPFLCFVPFTDATMETTAKEVVIKLTENIPAQLNSYFVVFAADAEVNITRSVCQYTPAATFSPAAAPLALSNSGELKNVVVKSTATENVELVSKPIVVKPYYGNYVREFSINRNSPVMF